MDDEDINKIFLLVELESINGRCGVVVGKLAYHARGRGFDSTVQTFVCMNMSICMWVFLCIICMYLQKKYISIY
jgi:hypothetical protein